MHRDRLLLPTPPPPTPEPDAFLLFPLHLLSTHQTPNQMAAQQALYQWAFAQAQAVVAPSILERDLLGVWN